MTTARELTNKINDLRAALGLEPKKYAGTSKQALQAFVDKLEREAVTKIKKAHNEPTAADLARQAGISPKAFRAKLRRHKAELAGMGPEQIIAALARDHRKS